MANQDDEREVQYHRNPTKGEVRFGYGAIHYRSFPASECYKPGTTTLKRWFVSPDDKLRYYR